MAGVAGGREAESSGATWVLGSMLAVLPSEDGGSLRKLLNVGNTWHIEVVPYSGGVGWAWSAKQSWEFGGVGGDSHVMFGALGTNSLWSSG